MHNKKYDPSMERLKPGTKVGVVGESAIWDGPLDQQGKITRFRFKFRYNRYASIKRYCTLRSRTNNTNSKSIQIKTNN